MKDKTKSIIGYLLLLVVLCAVSYWAFIVNFPPETFGHILGAVILMFFAYKIVRGYKNAYNKKGISKRELQEDKHDRGKTPSRNFLKEEQDQSVHSKRDY